MDYFKPETILILGILVGIALTLAAQMAVKEWHNHE